MTCVLRYGCGSREREIRNFVKTKYYKIVGTFGRRRWTTSMQTGSLYEGSKMYMIH